MDVVFCLLGPLSRPTLHLLPPILLPPITIKLSITHLSSNLFTYARSVPLQTPINTPPPHLISITFPKPDVSSPFLPSMHHQRHDLGPLHLSPYSTLVQRQLV